MNKSVNPIVALIIILMFGSLFGFKFYFYQQAADVAKLNYIKASPSGNIFIRLGEEIYDYTPSGKLNRVINLSTLNISNHFGDFAFFSNGDLLINRDEFLPSFKDRISRFFRHENTNKTIATDNKGLQRCNISTLICTQFTAEIPVLQGSFYLFIDIKTDDVYLADTSRHQIRKLDKEGHLLAEMTSDLAFPNQLWLEQSSLWIVDTNHHVMKAVHADTDTFGEPIEQHSTTASGQWIWPSAFAKVQDNWWLTISNHAMEDAKIVIFDSLWKKGETLSLPDNADPISSLVVNDKVLITDANQFSLYQFDFEGNKLPDFAIQNNDYSGIQSALKRNETESDKFILWSDYCLWISISLFIPIFIFALLPTGKENSNKQAANSEAKIVQLTTLPVDGEWLEAKRSIKIFQWIAFIAVIISTLSLLGVFYSFKNKLSIELFTLGFFIPFFAFILIPVRKLSQLRIGFFNDNVTIETGAGQLISSPYRDIK